MNSSYEFLRADLAPSGTLPGSQTRLKPFGSLPAPGRPRRTGQGQPGSALSLPLRYGKSPHRLLCLR